MDGFSPWITGHDLHQVIGEFRRGAVGGGLGKVPPGFRLNAAEDVSRAASLVLTIATDDPSRAHGPRGTDIGMQHDRLFI